MVVVNYFCEVGNLADFLSSESSDKGVWPSGRKVDQEPTNLHFCSLDEGKREDPNPQLLTLAWLH